MPLVFSGPNSLAFSTLSFRFRRPPLTRRQVAKLDHLSCFVAPVRAHAKCASVLPNSYAGANDDLDARPGLAQTAAEAMAVAEMFAAHPGMRDRAASVLRKYGCATMPLTTNDADRTEYWRRVVDHYVVNQDEEFDEDQPFYVIDLCRVIVQMAKWRKNLPGVTPYYAVKCNPSDALIDMVHALGGSFDCASVGEFTQVLGRGCGKPGDLIFANPCKMASQMKQAHAAGVHCITFDNETELDKIAKYMPEARAVLRIRTDDSAAVCAFSTKFGCPVPDAGRLLALARDLGVRIVGVSFHVGSGNNDPAAYTNAVRNARRIFDQGAQLGFDMKLLDLGGGWPGTEPRQGPDGKPDSLSFEGICAHIRPLLAELFQGVDVIGEPGRFFAASSYALAMSIHSTRTVSTTAGDEHQFYTTDGLYHSFNCLFFDHAHPDLHALRPDVENPLQVTTIFGPTCDSLDCILKKAEFPRLAVGDWLFVPDFGAYTVAAGAPFNGFATRRTKYVASLDL